MTTWKNFLDQPLPTIHVIIYSNHFHSNSPKEKEMRTEYSKKERKKKKKELMHNPLRKQIVWVTLWNNVKLKSIIITKQNIVYCLIKWFLVRSRSWWLKSWSQYRNEIPFYFIIWKDYSMQKSNFSEW